jgi:plastocyanin
MGRLLASVLAVLTFGVSPALSANQTVQATSANEFSPPSVSVAEGETVTWTNGGGEHNVAFDDGSFTAPMPPSASMWMVSRTFNQTGTFRYYCQIHGGSGGMGMSGTVTVTGAGGASPPSTGPPTVYPKDTAKPVASLSTPSKQDVDKLYVKASMNEAGALTAEGSVSVPSGAAKVYRFKTATRAVAANTVAKLRLKLSKNSLRAVKRALRHRKLRAKVTVTAKDGAGNRTFEKRTIRLTR